MEKIHNGIGYWETGHWHWAANGVRSGEFEACGYPCFGITLPCLIYDDDDDDGLMLA